MDTRNITLLNEDYFRMIEATPLSQTAVMCIKNADHGIPREFHSRSEQYFYIEAGQALVNYTHPSGNRPVTYTLTAGMSIKVPPGFYHDLVKVGPADLKLWTTYTPPNPDHYVGETRRRRQ